MSNEKKISDDKFLEAYERLSKEGYGFKANMAKELGLDKSTITQRIKRGQISGKIPLESGNVVGNAEMLKGTSTLHRHDPETGESQIALQWVKTDVKKEDILEKFNDAVDLIADRVRPAEPLPNPKYVSEDFMTKYVFADGHIGLLTWWKEVGKDFDLKDAEDIYIEAMRQTVYLMPPSKVCYVLDLGDTIHTDDQSNRTKGHHHQLDVDSRFDKLFDVAVKVLFAMIDIALQKHEIVIFRKTRGNHDEDSSIALGAIVEAYYRNEPRVIVERSPSLFFSYKFGKTLHFSTHGNNIKQKDLPEIIAHDCRDVWSEVEYVYGDTGHVHHQEIIETRTTKLESHNSMTASDSFNYGHGYRSMRLMKGISYSKDYGEQVRKIVTVKEVEDILQSKKDIK